MVLQKIKSKRKITANSTLERAWKKSVSQSRDRRNRLAIETDPITKRKLQRRLLTLAVKETISPIHFLSEKQRAQIQRAFQKHLNSNDGTMARAALEEELATTFENQPLAKSTMQFVEARTKVLEKKLANLRATK